MTLNLDHRAGVVSFRVKRKIRHLGKKAYQAIRPAEGTRPVFLVGCGRSGTDIVAYSINMCRDVDVVNEDNPKAFENWRLKDRPTLSSLINESKASIVVFKPIVETLKVPRLLYEFDDSQAIFVVRHPHDTINSMVRFFDNNLVAAVESWVSSGFSTQPGVPGELKEFISDKVFSGITVEDAAGLYWILYNSSYHFRDIDKKTNVLPILYEDLVRQPFNETQRLAKFVGVKWSEAMTHKIYSKSVGKNSKPNLDADIEARCLEIWRRLQAETEGEH